MSEASQAGKITVVSWTLGAIAVVSVGARLFSRTLLTRNAWWDDAFILFSLISALVCSSLVSVGIKHGLGVHYQSIPDPWDRIEAFKYTIIAPNFSVISTTTGKISVALFLLRMMGQAGTKAKRYFLYAITLISVIVNVMCIVVLIGFCIPARKIWDSSVPGRCMSLKTQLVIGTIQASYNAFTDFTLAVFPVFVFWNVQMPLKIRLIIIGVMGAGIFAAAATTVKAVLLKQLPQQDDITWAWAPITLWYSAEMYVIIICATMPTLRQFVLFMLGRSYHNSTGRSTNPQDNSGNPDSSARAGGSSRRLHLHSAKLSSFKSRMISSISSSNTHGDSLMVSRGDYDNLPGSQENVVPPIPFPAGSVRRSKEIELTAQVHVAGKR